MAMKEATEAVIFVEKLTEQFQKANADQKLEVKDLVYAPPLLPALYDAVKDLHKAAGEVRNANGEELQEFYQRASLATLNVLDAVMRK